MSACGIEEDREEEGGKEEEEEEEEEEEALVVVAVVVGVVGRSVVGRRSTHSASRCRRGVIIGMGYANVTTNALGVAPG